MFREVCLETRPTSTMELFLLHLSHTLKKYLIWSIFFFKIRNDVMEWNHHKKMNIGFLNQHLLKMLKLLVFVLFSFFYYFKYYGQNIFQKQQCLS